MSDPKYQLVLGPDVLRAIQAEQPISALNIARHHRWYFPSLCEVLGRLEQKQLAVRSDGTWHLTPAGRDVAEGR